MQFEFTPAAEGALAAASAWTSCDNAGELHVPEVLLGLLAEPECRSALLLAACGIDTAAVRDRFAALTGPHSADPARVDRFSAQWLECLKAAERLLIEYPRPLVLATEHLLLGIVAGGNEVSAWLNQYGLLTESLEAEVHRLSGHQPGPLPVEAGLAERFGHSLDEPPGEMPPDERLAALRVVDAAANRAAEGLRVIEDYLRFVLDDRHLTAECKRVRHELTAILEVVPVAERHAARDTRADVGTDLSTDSEQTRGGTAAVAQASFKRVEQSLRSLEEFCKTFAADAAAQLEQLRYRTYTLERAAGITQDSLARLADARLYVLLDGRASADEFGRLVASLLSAGVGAIQLRDKRLGDRELVARARLLVELTRDTGALAIVNDRPDLALLAGADGVHVGQEELSVKDARRVLGPRGLVGVSTHSLEQARAAVLDGASYLGVGPTFASDTKQFDRLAGVELLREVGAEIRLPAFAIGGITAKNLSDVLASGFTRVAVGGAIVGAADPAATAKRFLTALGG